MSGWNAAIKVLGVAGSPRTTKQIEKADPTIGASVYGACAEAERRGMVYRVRQGRGQQALWALTAQGWMLFENRLTLKVLPYTRKDWEAGRLFGTGAVLVSTWLAALPAANTIRLQAAPAPAGKATT